MEASTIAATGALNVAPTGEELARLRVRTDAGVALAFEAAPAHVREQLGLSVRRVGSSLAMVAARFPIAMFNRTVNLGIEQPTSEAEVDEIVAGYRALGVPFMVQVSPAAKPTELPRWLEERGVPLARPWAIFSRTLDALPEERTDLRVEEVGPEFAQAMGDVFQRGFGMPPNGALLAQAFFAGPGWRNYLAFDGGTAVAGATMLALPPIALMAGAATLEAYRGRGAQGALLARRLRDARDLGCSVATVETAGPDEDGPNASYRNQLRAGFQLAYLQPNYVFKPGA